MSIAILVHGFNVWDGGRASVGKLRPFFANRKTPYMMVNYGWFGIGQTYIKNNSVAKGIARACQNAKRTYPTESIILVGHSNGCAIIHQACKNHEAKVDKVVFINPALDADVSMPENMGHIDVWYSPSDKPVWLSKFLPFHPWGAMGRAGYKGPTHKRVRSFDKENDFVISSKGHSDVFSVELLPYFGPLIVKEALNNI